MATYPIQVEIFDSSVTNGGDACSSYTPQNNQVLFFSSNINIPTVGDVLYYDNGLTSPVSTNGSWTYLDSFDFANTNQQGFAAKLNSFGVITEIFNCTTGIYEFLIGTGDSDPIAACSNTPNTLVYIDRQLSELFFQPPATLYTASNLNPASALPGDNLWYANSGGTVTKVNNLGLITLGGSCSPDNNVLALTGGFDDKALACAEEASFNLFAATPISQIQPGDSLYYDAELTNLFLTPAGNQWFVDAILGTAYEMLDDIILSIEPCPTALTYDIFKFTTNAQSTYDAFCQFPIPNITFFYVAINQAITLAEIATLGYYPFATSSAAFTYKTALNAGQTPNPLTLVGLYQNQIFGVTTAPFIWNKTNVTWNAGSPCAIPVPQTGYAVTVLRAVNYNDPTAAEFCTDNKEQKTYYYVYDENSNLSLKDIAINNIAIYNTASGAYNANPLAMVKTNIFSDSTGYYVWINDNNGVGYQWYGFNNSAALTTGIDITTGGSCALYQRPGGYTPETITSPNPFAAKVYYAFWSCVPLLQNAQVLWPMYLIDGDHFVGQTNHITGFVDVMNSVGLNTFKNNPGTECMSYRHTIIADNIDNAELLLEQIAGYDPAWIQQKNAADIGIFSNNTVVLRTDCEACAYNTSPLGNYNFGVIEGSIPPTEGPNLDLEKNYNLDNLSKPLLRTNPKLTTNVKVIVSEGDQIFLESIDATKELAAVEYKKFELSRTGSYAQDLAAYYNTRRTPAEIMFATKRESSDLSVLDSYELQLEEAYQAGAISNKSKLYDEDFRIFAPIFLDTNVPKMFVIYKVNNPVDITGLTDSAADNFTRIQSMLANAEIVKTFDLTRTSAIGNYIRNHVQNEFFPKAPLTFSFEKGEKSTFNGIDLRKGGFTTKAEYMFEDFVLKDNTLIDANDLITGGFKRNELAVANIMNLEFLFNDPTSVDYSVNRYFGLYVDDIDSGYGNVITAEKGKLKFKSLNSFVAPTIPASAIPASKMMTDTPALGYVAIGNKYFKIANNKFYNEANFSLNVEDSQNEIKSLLGIGVNGKSVNIAKNDLIGYDYIKCEVVGTPVVNDKFAIVNIKEQAFKFNFLKHIPDETVTIKDVHDNLLSFNTSTSIELALDAFEASFIATLAFNNRFKLSRADSKTIVLTEKKSSLEDQGLFIENGNGNIIRVNVIYSNVTLSDELFYAAGPNELPKGTFAGNRFSADGSNSDIALAIAAAINKAGKFTATTLENKVYISTKIGGYKLMQHAFMLSAANNSQFIIAENLDANNKLALSNEVLTYWVRHHFKGGHSPKKSCLITNETSSQITIGDYLPTTYNNRYNKVIDIVEYTDGLRSGYKKCILTEPNGLDSAETNVYHEIGLRIGLFSAYDMYDMNFDFYDTANSDLKELKYETVANIAYAPYDDPLGLEADDIMDFDFTLSPDLYFSGLQPLLKDEEVNSNEPTAINTEFDRLQENANKTYALNSRVVPTINKWVLKDAFTSRDKPYYLNANEAFGKTNFTADISITERNREALTHEWFYLDKLPVYFRYDMVNDVFSYVNFMREFELTKDLFKSVTADYFDRFMIIDGIEVQSNSADLYSIDENTFDINTFLKTERQKKYSPVDGGNDLAFASTIFKGIKVFFKNRKEFDKTNPSEFLKNAEFNGYRFSTLVKVNTDAESNSVNYEVIQNKKFGFVIFFITLNITDLWNNGSMNRKLLYELNHDVIKNLNATPNNPLDDFFEYRDLQLDGALAINITDFSGIGPYTIKGIPHGTNGTSPSFDVQMTLGTNKVYGKILIDYGIGVIYSLDVLAVPGFNEIQVKGLPVNIADPSDILQTQYLTQSQVINAEYIYENAGVNAHNVLLSKLSSGYVADLLKNNDAAVKYTTINEDGTELNNRFTIEFDNGKEFLKIANLTTVEDRNIPKSYKLFKGAIGFEIEAGATYYPTLVRHSGNYTVDLTPVVTFTDLYTHFKANTDHLTPNPIERLFEEGLYKHSLSSIAAINIAKAYYKKYNRTGISFNLGFIQDNGQHDSKWGLIKNHFYHKVNEVNPTSVTKLTATGEEAPLYPLIAEIAIDKKDLNIFRSSWDSFYYTRSLEAGKTELVPGTLDTIEERSYMSSTIMTAKAQYDLTQFTTEIVATEEALDTILKNSNNKTDTVLFEDQTRIVIDFYMEGVVYKKLSDDGVLSTLTRFVKPTDSIGDKTSVVDDTESYVFKNLLDLYTLDRINLYVRAQKESVSNIISSNSVAELSTTGFNEDTAYTYRLHGQTPLNFRLIYNKRLGYSYDIRPMVKIRS